MNTLGHTKRATILWTVSSSNIKRLVYTAFYIPIVANLGGTLNNER